ncbi:ABC transporter ATP-binding protein [Desulfosporosinus shakirovi]|uniref:ABC transporter ATP-binding protein n=1 Tax=Desulfosporosinus shakirovi TaxID=2885154 RepID=UPI001E649AF9|nr:ABC transporter ATP-binding protein [Desulfosporosinus sp. SRJS8]MCB8814631.1 ABC transporter ATP-binding protein [Desulfosporosinus sp. SRJS8]
MGTAFFELRGISKYFAKVIANKDVSFSIQRGEVLALLGENGAGKSTIMKILYGLYKADEGELLKDGKEIKIDSPKEAMELGISMIQQHFSLVPAHTVTENIILGNVKGVIDYKLFREEIKRLAELYGFELNPNDYIRDLAVGVQQKVEILKALYQKTNLLIMDEPTAVLTPQEAENLMGFVRDFTAQGNSVIFITHKLKEVMSVADRIIVMRAGRVYGDIKRAETNELELSKLMIGRDLNWVTKDDRQESLDQEVRLEIQHVTVQEKTGVPALKDISLTLHKGEILGIAGVSGNGQQELCEIVCGAILPTKGRVLLDGEDITERKIRARIDLGIGYVPADRSSDGMIMDMSIAENMLLKSSYDKKWQKRGFIDKEKLNQYALQEIRDYSIKAPSPETIARGLSGGNQQKVVLAREVGNGEKVIVFDQPTRGLDLGAVNHIHQVILKERAKGKSVLLVSTELAEIFALSDRIAILYKGEIQGVFKSAELTTEKIGLLMAGFRKGEVSNHAG